MEEDEKMLAEKVVELEKGMNSMVNMLKKDGFVSRTEFSSILPMLFMVAMCQELVDARMRILDMILLHPEKKDILHKSASELGNVYRDVKTSKIDAKDGWKRLDEILSNLNENMREANIPMPSLNCDMLYA